MKVRNIKIADIKRAAYNPRKELKPGDAEWQRIADSIEHFGLAEPLVWNERSGNLVGGHQRLSVLLHLDEKLTAVPCSVVDLSDEDERALNVALNKIAGAWDNDKLRDLLGALPGNLLPLSGFTVGDLQKLNPAPLSAAAQLGDGMAYKVVVDCDSEEQQAELLARFESEGLTVRALMA